MKTFLTKLINVFLPYLQEALTPVLDDLVAKAHPVITQQVTEMIDEAMKEIDVEDAVERALADADIDRVVERAIDDAGISRAIEEAVEEFDVEQAIGNKCEEAVEEFDFDEAFEERIKSLIKKQYAIMLREMAEAAEQEV